MEHAHDHAEEKPSYRPLIVLLLLILAGALALGASQESHRLGWFLSYFMGLFFLVFALFKLLDLGGFADGFQMYDVVAKRWRGYALLYPFIELGLAVFYLSGMHPPLANALTLMVMSLSALGVMLSMQRKMNVRCACLGTVLNVPLSTVSLLENIGMGLMAFFMLLAM